MKTKTIEAFPVVVGREEQRPLLLMFYIEKRKKQVGVRGAEGREKRERRREGQKKIEKGEKYKKRQKKFQ